MTLNGRYALYCRKDASFGVHHKNYRRQKCTPMTLVSGDIKFMQIFADIPWGGGVKRQWGCRERKFLAFSLAISSETLEMRSALSYSDTQSVVSSSVISKCVTLNDLKWLFRVKCCFRDGLAVSDSATFEKQFCMKTNKDRHIITHTISRANLRRDSSFWQYKILPDIRSGSLERRPLRTVGSRVNACLEHLFLALRVFAGVLYREDTSNDSEWGRAPCACAAVAC